MAGMSPRRPSPGREDLELVDDLAAAPTRSALQTPLGTLTEEGYDRSFDINMKGSLFTVQKMLPLLSDGASIIFTSSVVGSKGFRDRSVYSATKAALRSLARTLTSDLRGRRIRVNVVSPGTIDTPGLRGLSNRDADGLNALYGDAIPLGRVGHPDEVAPRGGVPGLRRCQLCCRHRALRGWGPGAGLRVGRASLT